MGGSETALAWNHFDIYLSCICSGMPKLQFDCHRCQAYCLILKHVNINCWTMMINIELARRMISDTVSVLLLTNTKMKSLLVNAVEY